jgi:hypothetical protein
MVHDRAEIIAAARACVGARFRPHGRDPAHGLDCVGVAAIAFGQAVPGDYAIRGGSTTDVARVAGAAGLRAVAPEQARSGDLVLIEAGPGQLHIAILTEAGFVHADAGLRRVVEVPGRPAGRVLAAWTMGD